MASQNGRATRSAKLVGIAKEAALVPLAEERGIALCALGRGRLRAAAPPAAVRQACQRARLPLCMTTRRTTQCSPLHAPC